MAKLKGSLFAIILTTVLLFVYYSNQIIHADTLIPSPWGDGYKNYYTLAYYLKYDSGTYFSGMNYPYGEHVMFTDNQPAVAWLLKLVVKIFPSITNHIHALIAWLIFLSIVAAAFFVHKVLIEFEVSEFHAAVFASLIALLSPQIQRLHTHFSLSYTCFVPILLFLLIRFFRTKGNAPITFCLIFLISFFGFIHVYYVAIAGVFIFLIALFFLLSNIKKLNENIRFVLLLVTTAITPFLIVKFFLLLTDPVIDRPQNPWGFVANRSTMADIFLHPFSFTGETLGKIFPPEKLVYHFEGTGYIGLAGVTMLVVLLLFWVIKMADRKPFLIQFYPFNYLLPAAFLILLIAMAFPFSIDPLEKYYNYLPASVKQFRSSGRFNWVFYYTYLIFTSIFIYRLYVSIKGRKKYLAYVFISAVYSLWFIEVNMISNRYVASIEKGDLEMNEKNEFDLLNRTLTESGKNVDDFQAIFPLPFFLNGSEKIYIESASSFHAMKTSLATGLPLACGQMSRTSQSQTFKIVNLISNELMKKEIVPEYKNRKPLLLMYDGAQLTPNEKNLLDRSDYLFTCNRVSFFEMPVSAFNDSQGEAKRYVTENRNSFHRHDEYASINSVNNVLVKRFEKEEKNSAVFGNGFNYNEHRDAFFYFDTLPNATDNTLYEISFWVYADNHVAGFPVLYVSQVDEWGKDIEQYNTNVKFGYDTYKNWMRGEINFTLLNRKNKIYISGNGDFASFDELMVRPKNVTVITDYKNDSTFMYNNFPIR